MDILIKNFELPQDEGVFICICPNGSVQVQVGWVGDSPVYNIAKGVEAVALPEHGTLKDTDFMLSCLEEIKKDYPEAYKLVSGIIERTPTIVEASK